MAPSNKYRKIEKSTLLKLMKNVEKERVKKVMVSLRDFNRKIMAQNNMSELLDDMVYMSIKFDKNIEILNENTKIGALGGQTPVQIGIPNGMYSLESEILLLVRDGEIRAINTLLEESQMSSHITVSSPLDFASDLKNKNQMKKALSQFDVILID